MYLCHSGCVSMVWLQAFSGDEEFHLIPEEFTLGQLELQTSLLKGIQKKG